MTAVRLIWCEQVQVSCVAMIQVPMAVAHEEGLATIFGQHGLIGN